VPQGDQGVSLFATKGFPHLRSLPDTASRLSESYKDIEDENFNEVVEYIEFLKNNPS